MTYTFWSTKPGTGKTSELKDMEKGMKVKGDLKTNATRGEVV